MDLFNKVENKSHKGTEDITNYEIKGKKYSKLLFDFRQDCTFKHGDKVTNLIEARMLEQYEKNQSIAPDTAKHICFELPSNVTVYNLAEDKVFDVLDKIGILQNANQNEYYHMGIIEKDKDGKYKLYTPTDEVLEYINEKMNFKVDANNNLFAKRLQEFRNEMNAKEYLQQSEENRKERKNSPFFEEQFRYKIGGKIYQDYKATDIVDGKILKINRLDAVYKEKEILYSAYIEKIENEEEKESITLQEIPDGIPILFNLRDEIEKSLKNKENMQKVLELVSNLPREKMNVKELHYIGGIDENGNIYRKMENCSEIIKNEIKKQKENYKKEITENEQER